MGLADVLLELDALIADDALADAESIVDGDSDPVESALCDREFKVDEERDGSADIVKVARDVKDSLAETVCGPELEAAVDGDAVLVSVAEPVRSEELLYVALSSGVAEDDKEPKITDADGVGDFTFEADE